MKLLTNEVGGSDESNNDVENLWEIGNHVAILKTEQIPSLWKKAQVLNV